MSHPSFYRHLVEAIQWEDASKTALPRDRNQLRDRARQALEHARSVCDDPEEMRQIKTLLTRLERRGRKKKPRPAELKTRELFSYDSIRENLPTKLESK